MVAKKRNVTYTKDMRAAAKAAGTGLITIQTEDLDGTVIETQHLAGPLQSRFAHWARAWLFSEEVHQLPDLEAHYLAAMEQTP